MSRSHVVLGAVTNTLYNIHLETKDLMAVSYQCGHKDTKITKEVYVHDNLEQRRKAMEKMERALA